MEEVVEIIIKNWNIAANNQRFEGVCIMEPENVSYCCGMSIFCMKAEIIDMLISKLLVTNPII